MLTTTEARFWAETGVEILFSEGDPFSGKVDRARLIDILYNTTLKKLIEEDTSELSEEEFNQCVAQCMKARLN